MRKKIWKCINTEVKYKYWSEDLPGGYMRLEGQSRCQVRHQQWNTTRDTPKGYFPVISLVEKGNLLWGKECIAMHKRISQCIYVLNIMKREMCLPKEKALLNGIKRKEERNEMDCMFQILKIVTGWEYDVAKSDEIKYILYHSTGKLGIVWVSFQSPEAVITVVPSCGSAYPPGESIIQSLCLKLI